MKKIIHFFDRIEDRVRAVLSRHPIPCTFIGGTAIVLFWRGVWLTADNFPFLTGPVSILISVGVLLFTGLFVSFFITDRIILSGLKHEKRVDEKTLEEIKKEESMLFEISRSIALIKSELEEIKNKIK